MVKEITNRKNTIAEVVRVGVTNEDRGTIELATEEGDLISLDLSVATIAPVIMALFSAASALQDRRYAATRERTVLALPVREAAATAVAAGGARHVVVSLRLGNEAIFRFSLPSGTAAELSRSLAEAVGSGLN
ncbi:hypothetical protein [Amaricoccus solimangrovi]|uniref:Uncharacterized protein n=1 Tax=Amaricoccus solimangrovi TaxID=2589815 RepID=A0A501X1B6_9RHOB|nr:hypothetical protein [Amaricoccus solimangrovi]TPE53616.1 hypothetical protein FJM51_00770 [Amaricoccus solimangrovi]